MFSKWKRDKQHKAVSAEQGQAPYPGQTSSAPYYTTPPPPMPTQYPPYAPPIPPRPDMDNMAPPSQAYVNAAYYPNWRVYKQLPPSSLQVRHLTHVFYSFIGVNTDGTLKHFDEYADLQIEVDGVKGCLAALQKLKHHNPHIRTIVSFGGGSGSAEFPALAANPQARDTFARAARHFVDQHGLDGVDIDWEQPSNAHEGEHYVLLLADLRQAFPRPRYLVTTALPCGEWALQHIPLARAAGFLDMLNLMAYDFSGPWTKVAAHHAQLWQPHPTRLRADADACLRLSTAQAAGYLLAHGVHPSQVVVGVPAYARFFRGARGPGDAYVEAGEVDYNELAAEADVGAAAAVDPHVGAAWLVDDARGFVSLDTPATVAQKAAYVRANRLAGLFYWQGVGDVREGPLSLIAAGAEGLGRAP